MKPNTKGNESKLHKALDLNRVVCFDYFDKKGKKITNVLAKVITKHHNKRNELVYGFGILKSNSSAHPGWRPISLDKIRNVRIRGPKVRDLLPLSFVG